MTASVHCLKPHYANSTTAVFTSQLLTYRLQSSILSSILIGQTWINDTKLTGKYVEKQMHN